ncbi:mechanosensitive ion channel [Methylonatrum kenyense]|uniref:mechanosensitive ion channel domain-containing protein n=1 Tax=Methylonatrum kenyense TaxID=455253 RepID=UPI0020BED190|nr:mechanosensitive ion channel [Methylonatrum kenyense]
MLATRLSRFILSIFLLLGLLALGAPAATAESTGQGSDYAVLADILEDDERRNRLITELRLLSEPPEMLDEEAAPSGQDEDTVSLPRRIAMVTQGFAEQVVDQFNQALVALRSSDVSMDGVSLAAMSWAALNLGGVILITVGAFLALRRLAKPLFDKASLWAAAAEGSAGLLRRAAAIVYSAVLDILVVVLAWVAGYVVALFVFGETGAMDSQQTLFLNAFLLIEVFKALIRVIFASRNDTLRLLPMTAENAAYWNVWLARLAGFIGYGLMLVVPIINFNVSPVVGQGVSLLIMLLAFIYAVSVISQNRQDVRDRLEGMAAEAEFSVTRVLTGMLARSWHLIAIAYFLSLFVVTVVNPEAALPFMAKATIQTLVAVGVGFALELLLTSLVARPMRIPAETHLKFPMLEARLNSYIPKAVKAVQVLVLVTVFAVVLDAWGIFNLATWLVSDAGLTAIARIITVGLVIAVATLIWIGVASWIEHRLNPETGGGEPTSREKTLLTIFRNAIAIVIITMAVMISLAELGINIGPLIAGAGVLGLAIGFGAQKLVQDIITGVFIQLENAINAGDVVTAGGITGTAEKLSVRSVGIRDLSGTMHIVPFSAVDTVSNYMRDFGYHVGEYGVAYREDTDTVIQHLREAFDELVANEEHAEKVIGELEVHGVTALADSSVNVRVRIKTTPGTQWGIGREYNRLVKRHFDAANIEIPFPHTTIYFGQDKDGSAPPLLHRKLDNGKSGQDGDSASGDASAQSAKANPKYKGDFDDADD